VTRVTPRYPILVVESNSKERSVLTDVLARASYSVDAVESGEAALEWLERQPASLIIIDLLMPGMSGFDLLSRLRESPETNSIPVIVIAVKELSELQAAQLRQSIAQVVERGQLAGNSLVEQVQIALNRQLQQARNKPESDSLHK
jgi:CheY-like chemotaxis protein